MIVKIRCKFDTIFLFKSHKNKYNTPRQLSPGPVLTNVDLCVISLSYFFLYMLQTSRSTVAEFCFVHFRQECGIRRCVFIGWQPFYSPSTSFSFCLKMFFNSPRVDSIFSRENWFSPSTVLSLATQELSSVTVVSSRVHSFSRVSTFLTQSSDTALTLLYFSLRAATSLSASSWVVIFLEADSAATSTAKEVWQLLAKLATLSFRALTSSRLVGFERPSLQAPSEVASQGVNSLIPVLYSAQNLTSSEYLSHSHLVLACRSVTYFVILLSSSLKSWASWGTLSPWGRRSFSVAAFFVRISTLAAMSSCRSMVLATLSSGSMLPLWFLMSSSSAVAVAIQESIALNELSKSLS